MIAIYDSGLWWALTLSYFRKVYGHYDYVLFADNAYLPYGDRDPDFIRERVFANLHYLFDTLWVTMVILACNTASAFAIRAWQEHYPEKKVLSVTIPGVEYVIDKDYRNIGILATPKTILSNMYGDLFERWGAKESYNFTLVQSQDLVDAIESWVSDQQERMNILLQYTDMFSQDLDCVILGCTHYPLRKDEISDLVHVPLVDPSEEAVKQFGPYLRAHTMIEESLSRNGTVRVFFTKKSDLFERHVSDILDHTPSFSLVESIW